MQLVKVPPLLSPLTNTPAKPKIRSAVVKVPSRIPSCIPSKIINTSAQHTRSNLHSRKSKLLAKLHASTDRRFGVTQTLAHAHTRSESPKQKQQQQTQQNHHQHARTNATTIKQAYTQVHRTIHHRELYESYKQRGNREKICAPLKNVCYTNNSITRNQFTARLEKIGEHQHQANARNTVSLKPTDELNTEEFIEPEISLFQHNRQINSTNQSGPIVERHNFEEEIQIKVKNDRPITIEERQIDNTVNTRIIHLHNKNVPHGVHLAIAVDKNKRFSKNALKKITRNLAGEM